MLAPACPSSVRRAGAADRVLLVPSNPTYPTVLGASSVTVRGAPITPPKYADSPARWLPAFQLAATDQLRRRRPSTRR